MRDDQWARIKDLLPGRQGHVGVTAKDNRLFVEAVLHRYRAGIPWRDLPALWRLPGGRRRHTRWSRRGVWLWALAQLSADADNEYAMLDATIVRAHQHSAGAKKRRTARRGARPQQGRAEHEDPCRGGRAGQPAPLLPDARPDPRPRRADQLLPRFTAPVVIADKGHDADERVLTPVQQAGKTAVILARRHRHQPRDDDRHLYAARHLIENGFAKLKQYRAIATRYDKRAAHFLGAIYLAATVITLNR